MKTPNGTTLDVDFLIAKDFPFPVISAGQTLLKGYKLKSLEKDMTTNVIKGMLTNGQEEVPIEQFGTLLYIPTVGIHPRTERRILAPMPLSEPMQVEQQELLKPQGGRTDFWERKGEILVRHHKRPRNKLYTPARARDCPVPIDQLQLGRLTAAHSLGGTTVKHEANWLTSSDAKTPPIPEGLPAKSQQLWTGETHVRIVAPSVSTGSTVVSRTAIAPPPDRKSVV